jgi:hypothetical protein
MTARAYSFSIIGTALLLFWSIVAANLLLDPQGIYWRDPSVRTATTNDRYVKSRIYMTSPDRYEGFLFSSSRGFVMPLDELSRDFGGVGVASFSVGYGSIPDYLLALKFLLRDKQSRHSRLQEVFLLLDIDTFGSVPLAERMTHDPWPPQVTGEGVLPFWWRNLTAIQFEAWKDVRRRGGGWWAENESRHSLLRTVSDAGAPSFVSIASAQTVDPKPPGPQPSVLKDRVRTGTYYKEHLAMLREFVELCSKNQIRLVAALSPLRRSRASLFDEEDLERAVEDVSHILPVWDFGVPQWLDNEWTDISHFSPTVAHLMLERIFQDNPPTPREGFGVLRGN